MANDCIFCKIVERKVPASVVAEDERTFAFLDTTPITTGHTLVIPRIHATYLADLPEGVGGALFENAQRVAAAQRRALRAKGVNLFLADGSDAGQAVFHVHLHVIPRFPEDDFGLRYPSGYGTKEPREELDATAAKLRAVLPR